MSDAPTMTPETPSAPLLESTGGGNVDATLLGDASAPVATEDGSSNTDTPVDSVTTSNASEGQTESAPAYQDGLAPLPENATDDQRADFQKKLRALNGTPNTVEEYGNFGFDDGVINTNSEDYKYYSKLFHDIGLNKEQAKKLLEGHHKYASEMLEFQKRHKDEEITEYRRKVKNDFIKECGGEAQYNEFVDVAQRGFKAAAIGAGVSDKDAKGMLSVMGDDPRFVKIFHAIGKMHREDVLVTGTAQKVQEKTFDEMFSEMFKAS